MYKALLIGCGNIGALYDFDSEDVFTHAKAYYLHPEFELTIFDQNEALARTISKKYNFKILKELTNSSLSNFDCVSICSPTTTHFEFLKMALNCNTKVIICEKPISNDIKELKDIRKLYIENNSKILVNYIRRFQPKFIELKKTIQEILKAEKLTNISIRYQRGFVNNCSHALDLLQFLTNNEIEFKNIYISNRINDHFENDATLSMICNWKNINVSILGLSDVNFSLFEIELYFTLTKVSIFNAGNDIRVYSSLKTNQFLLPLQNNEKLSKEKCIDNYMISVIDNAFELLEVSNNQDNFLESLNLNEKILNYINK